MKKPVKICLNPDCGDDIPDYKSSKKKYCNDYCRNHHGYLRRLENYKEFDIQKKGLVNNYRILKMYIDAGILKEDLDKLLKFGFNPKYLPQKNVDEKFSPNMAYYFIKDVAFGLDPKTNQVLMYSVKK